MNEILRRRGLFLIPKNMKKILDITITAENYDDYHIVQYNSNSLDFNYDSSGKPLNITNDYVLFVEIPKDSEWATGNVPTFYLYQNKTGEMKTGQPTTSAAITKCVFWVQTQVVEDFSICNAVFVSSQYYTNRNINISSIMQGKPPITNFRLSCGTFQPPIGTRIRVYA